MTAQYFIKPLNDLEDNEARLAGLLLLREEAREFTVPFLQAMTGKAGLTLDSKRILEICNDLVINNVLAWKNGVFCIANEGLRLYANKMEYLSNALAETRRKLNLQPVRDAE